MEEIIHYGWYPNFGLCLIGDSSKTAKKNLDFYLLCPPKKLWEKNKTPIRDVKLSHPTGLTLTLTANGETLVLHGNIVQC